MTRFIEACKAFWRTLTAAATEPEEPPTPSATDQEKEPKPPPPPGPPPEEIERQKRARFQEGAVYTLCLLQREGRLVDFLREDISGFDDEQVGAAARQIHEGCGKILEERFRVRPILKGEEGAAVAVADDFDPSEIRMTGNVPANPPFNGTLEHKGWIAGELSLPERKGKINAKVIHPAEVSH